MNPKSKNDRKPNDVSKKVDQVSKSPSSAEEQKNNIPQCTKNTDEEYTSVYPEMRSRTNYKSLSVQSVFAIPGDSNYTEEHLSIILADSIRKFYGMSTHLPELPEEFALALAIISEDTNSIETVKVVWMNSSIESAFLPNLNEQVNFYDLKVVEVLSSGEFEEVIDVVDGKEISTGYVKVKEKLFNQVNRICTCSLMYCLLDLSSQLEIAENVKLDPTLNYNWVC